jgi:hypothetical protein
MRLDPDEEAAERPVPPPSTDLAAIIDRTATIFDLAEEPAHFLVVLEGEDDAPADSESLPGHA